MDGKTTHVNSSVILQHLPNRYWFIVSSFIFLLSAFIYLATATDKYKVTAEVIISDNSRARSVADDIESKLLIQKAIDQLPLQVSYYHKGSSSNSEIEADSLPVKIVFNKANAVDSSAELTLKVLDNQQFELRQNDTIIQYYFNKPVTYTFATFKAVKGPAFSTTAGPIRLKFNESNMLVEEYYNTLMVYPADDKTIGLSIITTNPQKGEVFLNKLIAIYNSAFVNHIPATNLPNTHAVVDNKSRADRIETQIETLKDEINELEKKGKQFVNARDTGKINDNKLSKTDRDLQLKTLDAIQPYVKNSVNQFVQIPYGSELNDKQLGGLVIKFNQIELDKQKDLRDSQANRVRIADFNRQIAGLKTDISQKITDVRDKIKGRPRKSTSWSDQSAARQRSLTDSIIVKKALLKAAMSNYAALAENKIVQTYSESINKRDVIADKSRLILLEKPGKQIVSYPRGWLVYLLALLAGLIAPIALYSLKYLKLPNEEIVQLKKLQAWLYEMMHPKEID